MSAIQGVRVCNLDRAEEWRQLLLPLDVDLDDDTVVTLRRMTEKRVELLRAA